MILISSSFEWIRCFISYISPNQTLNCKGVHFHQNLSLTSSALNHSTTYFDSLKLFTNFMVASYIYYIKCFPDVLSWHHVIIRHCVSCWNHLIIGQSDSNIYPMNVWIEIIWLLNSLIQTYIRLMFESDCSRWLINEIEWYNLDIQSDFHLLGLATKMLSQTDWLSVSDILHSLLLMFIWTVSGVEIIFLLLIILQSCNHHYNSHTWLL